MHIKDNNKSPHGKCYSFLFPFSCKFPDLNFAPYVLMSHVLTRRVGLEPELPMVGPGTKNQLRWRLKNVLVQNLNFTVISPFVLNFNTVA